VLPESSSAVDLHPDGRVNDPSMEPSWGEGETTCAIANRAIDAAACVGVNMRKV